MLLPRPSIGTADRGTPDCNHRITYELVDRAAMFEDDIAQHFEVAVEQGRNHLRLDRVAQLGEAFKIGEDDKNLALFAVQGEAVGSAQDFGGNVARQVFAKRALGKLALFRTDRTRGRPHRGKGGEPAYAPAKGGQALGVDAA